MHMIWMVIAWREQVKSHSAVFRASWSESLEVLAMITTVRE